MSLKTLIRISAGLSSAFCLLGGLWILGRAGFLEKGDALSTAIGLYFVGKSFFVGPMLLVAAEQLGRAREGK